MKRFTGILIISLYSVIFFGGHLAQAAEKSKYPRISYSGKPIDVDRVSSDATNQWQEVFKNYPTAAIVFMCQEAAQTSFAYQQIEAASGALPAYVNAADTPLASALEDATRLKSCIDKFIRCDMRTASDGVVSIGKIHGCSTSFSNCWTGNKE